jgi:methylated-DNA-[protein]-cysteine S-methyltransferase
MPPSRVHLDVTYATTESPLGPLLLAATSKGVVRVAFDSESPEEVLEELALGIGARPGRAPGRLDGFRRELDEYFEGRRSSFDVGIDWSLISGFSQRVLEATARVPYGSVTTYGDVARRAGSPRGARAAGNVLSVNPMPIVVPCHRVVHSGGGLGGSGNGLERRKFLLELEGALA